jgi:2-polyprenyl-3-methyl-5-hydroxy-6-metoxy-1,4-benzoquinol methylase
LISATSAKRVVARIPAAYAAAPVESDGLQRESLTLRVDAAALEAARRRTALRYRACKLLDRKYVEGKLRYDPVLACVAELGENLGRVLDAGAGRGQLALCLLELGLARSVRGFDLDAKKIEVARRATGDGASFEVGNLTSVELTAFDTLLMIDVLHYLRLDDQNALLERAARALEPGGTILIRETDRARRGSGFFTRLAERVARLIGWHRAEQELYFRPLAEVVAQLERLGLRCRVLDASRGTPFSNQLIVATRVDALRLHEADELHRQLLPAPADEGASALPRG